VSQSVARGVQHTPDVPQQQSATQQQQERALKYCDECLRVSGTHEEPLLFALKTFQLDMPRLCFFLSV